MYLDLNKISVDALKSGKNWVRNYFSYKNRICSFLFILYLATYSSFVRKIILLLLGFITPLLGLYAGPQLSVLDALPQLLIESFLCLYHFCISMVVWQVSTVKRGNFDSFLAYFLNIFRNNEWFSTFIFLKQVLGSLESIPILQVF